MQLTNTPGKLVLPFANAGAKNTIPTASQIGITAGAASLTDGFPPLTRTPIAAGGVPPSGLDMNGILYALSAALRWANAGGGYVFDSTFANDSNVGGYPKGARILRSDGLGYWLNTAENNTTDPEAVGGAAAGWVPDLTNGVAAVTMTSSNVTLTALQYGKPIIVLSGVLTANLNLIFPNLVNEWTVINSTTGAYTITCKTAAGTGVVAPQAGATIIYGDATNIGYAFTRIQTPAQFANTMDIATTGFVKRQGLQAADRIDKGVASTLLASDAGKAVTLSVDNGDCTLPSASGVPAGAMFEFLASTQGSPTTVKAPAGDLIYFGPSSASQIVIQNGDTFRVVAGGAGVWYAFGGSGALQKAGSFNSSLATNGYQKLPSGLIIQWGSATINGDTSASITYPLAFPNSVLATFATLGSSLNGTYEYGVGISPQAGSKTTATIMVITNQPSVALGCNWLAIGY